MARGQHPISSVESFSQLQLYKLQHRAILCSACREDKMAENIPLGFDGVSGDEDRGSPTDYTVQFTPSSAPDQSAENDVPTKQDPGKLEEIGLLDPPKQRGLSDEERVGE